MYDYERTIDILQDFDRMGRKSRRKAITAILLDDRFVKWLFQPEDVPNLTGIVENMYFEFTKTPTMQAIADAIDYEGTSAFTRSHAVFIRTVANIATQENDEVTKGLDAEYDMSRRDRDRVLARVRESNLAIVALLKKSRKIVKSRAKQIAEISRLEKCLAYHALTTIPDPEYIDSFKIGYYLNNLFNNLYSDVYHHGSFGRNVRWRIFFSEVFGENNVPDVATFILLEGVHRIDKYKSSRDVQECWDSLTNFALKELNDSPTSVRNQMIELYIKRVAKLLTGNTFDLRIDLLNLGEFSNMFPKLKETVAQYADKIKNAISGALKLADA